jgi:subtilisin family serine protease
MTIGSRNYLVVPAEGLQAAYEAGRIDAVTDHIVEALSVPRAGWRVVGLPSRWRLILKGGDRGGGESLQMPPLQQLVCVMEFDSPGERERFESVNFEENVDKKGKSIRVGVDMGFHGADAWCPDEAADPIFGNRNAAETLIRSDYLRDHRLSGQDVNVVIVDEGIDASKIPHNYAGGWAGGPSLPGSTVDGHGMMIVRNVLALAPRAKIFDCPLLPPHISDVPMFASDAQAVYDRMLTDIRYLRQLRWGGPNWVFVNAWAVYDRKSDPGGQYTNNPTHPFNVAIANTDGAGIDVVFCAGNCGLFCPRSNCGARDRGPGYSIHGANSHAKVLTAGAVRTDGTWLGYSSEGPGQSLLAKEKPDLCAPSQFCETHDAHARNTGTSASCALAAGVIAALRSRWDYAVMSPEELRGILRTTARRKPNTNWNGRLGYGIMDAAAAFKEAHVRHP